MRLTKTLRHASPERKPRGLASPERKRGGNPARHADLRRWRRRGSALYLTVVAVSIMVAGMGWAVIATQRADRRIQSNLAAESKAWWCARAGMEMAFLFFEQVPDWRWWVGNENMIFSEVPVGGGACDVQLIDEIDGNILDDNSQQVRVVAIGRADGATVRLQARLMPRPHPCLRYAAFNPTSNDTEFIGSAVIKGPVRSHGNIRSAAGVTLLGNAWFETMTGYTIQDPLTPKSFVNTAIPAPNVDMGFYENLAMPIFVGGGATCTLKGCNLTPTYSSFGPPNPSGIYSLDAGGREVAIENIHIKGTLIITNTGGNRVGFTKGAWIEPGPLNYPVLLVDTGGTGPLEISLDQANLVEASIQLNIAGINIGLGGVDFNENGWKLDTLPSSVTGIIWANTSVADLKTGSWPFVGCLVSSHPIVENTVSINDDPVLQTVLVPGFLDSGMRLIAGSYGDAP